MRFDNYASQDFATNLPILSKFYLCACLVKAEEKKLCHFKKSTEKYCHTHVKTKIKIELKTWLMHS